MPIFNTIDDLREWVKQGDGRRSVSIEIGEPSDKEYFRIWFYDYDLGRGAAAHSLPCELDPHMEMLKSLEDEIKCNLKLLEANHERQNSQRE